MPIHVIWDDAEQTTIRYALEHIWSWGELYDAVTASNTMIESVGRRTDFIYDATTSAGIPGGALTHLRGMIGRGHALTGRSVVVGTSKSRVMMLAQNLTDLAERLYHPRWGMMFAGSLDEARALLRAERERSQA